MKCIQHAMKENLLLLRFIRTLKNKIFKHMTAISENVCFDVLDDIVIKFNRTVHRTIKIKPIDVTGDSYAECNEDFNKKDPKFKVGDHARTSKYKKIFAKRYTPNWSEEVFVVNKIKNAVPWTYVVSDLNEGRINGSFYEKQLQKTNQKEFRIEKVLKRKGDKLYVKREGCSNSFNSCIDKKDLVASKIKMSKYFPKSFRSFGRNINVKVDLSNYATKTDIRNISHVDTSSFLLKANLTALQTEVDQLDIDKLVPVPTDLSKLSNVVKNDAVKKKTAYDKLVTKVNNIYTNDFVLKTKYETDKSELENKIPDTSGLIKKTDNNTKITELENKIPDISNLVTKAALSSVENKIPDVSNLVNKTDCSTKVTQIENKLNNHNHDKYIDTSEFNKLTADVFNARIAQANLITKTDFDAKLSSFNRKITQNKTKHLLEMN